MGRRPLLTTTGYRGWGRSSSRPSRRRTRRIIDPPSAPTSHGWVSNRRCAPLERCSAAQTQKALRVIPLDAPLDNPVVQTQSLLLINGFFTLGWFWPFRAWAEMYFYDNVVHGSTTVYQFFFKRKPMTRGKKLIRAHTSTCHWNLFFGIVPTHTHTQTKYHENTKIHPVVCTCVQVSKLI